MPELARVLWYRPDLEEKPTTIYGQRRYVLAGKKGPIEPVSDRKDANLISSLLPNQRHAPAIDLDFPCRLVASRTQGHFHLYLERSVTWRQYKRLLRVMMRIGLVEKGYYYASKAAGATFLRLPQKGSIRTWEAEKADREDIDRAVTTLMSTLGFDDEDESEEADKALTKITEHVSEILNKVVARRLNGD
jgi:hypothetical protein